jgi:Pectate lyase superfamily protein
MSQLGRFYGVFQSPNGAAHVGSLVTLYREGATVNGAQSGTSPLAVTVRNAGKILTGDVVFINTTTGTSYSATRTSATVLTLSGFAGTLVLAGGERIIPSNNLPVLYSNDQGTVTTTNPLTTNANGTASCWMDIGVYDFIEVTVGAAFGTLYQSIITPGEPRPISVLDFGAVGDGTTDDYTAFNAAITVLGVGGSLYVPPGKTYRISQTLILPNQFCLYSDPQPHQSAPLITTTDAYAFPNVIQNFAGSGNENPSVGDASSYYVSLRNLRIGVKNSTIKNIVHFVHLFETSVIENIAFWIDTSTVQTSCFKHSQNTAASGYGGQWEFLNTQFTTLGSATIKRLVDITSSSVWIERGNWVTNLVDGTADAVSITLGNAAIGDSGGGYGTIQNVNFESSPGDLRAHLLWANKGTLHLRGCNFVPSKGSVSHASVERPIAIRCTGTAWSGKELIIDACSFWSDSSRTSTWWFKRIISDEVTGSSNFYDMPVEGYHVNDLSSYPQVGGAQVFIIDHFDTSLCTYTRAGSARQDYPVTVRFNGFNREVDSGISAGSNYRIWGGVYALGDRIRYSKSGLLLRTFTCTTAGGASRETYSGASTYKAGDWVVGSNARIYRAIVDIAAGTQDPTTDATNTYWEQMATQAAVFWDDGIATQNITAAATTLTSTSATLELTADNSYTLSNAPTVADGYSGQELLIINVDTVDTITLQDQGTLASSNLRLSAATIALGPRDSIRLRYNATIGDWIQVAQTNVL